MSADILKLIKVRNKVFARRKRQPDNENCKRLYNLLRNRFNRELKKSTKQYYAEYFASSINNTKNRWDGIREIVNFISQHFDFLLEKVKLNYKDNKFHIFYSQFLVFNEFILKTVKFIFKCCRIRLKCVKILIVKTQSYKNIT